MLVLLKAMLVSLLPCLPHTLSYPYPLLLIELVHLLPCLFFPHVCSPVSSSTYQLTPLPSLPHTLSYPYPLLLIELVHLLPCLLLSHVCSPCLLVNLSTYPITLSSITINLSTCLLVYLSTYPITLSSSYPVIPLSPCYS